MIFEEGFQATKSATTAVAQVNINYNINPATVKFTKVDQSHGSAAKKEIKPEFAKYIGKSQEKENVYEDQALCTDI